MSCIPLPGARVSITLPTLLGSWKDGWQKSTRTLVGVVQKVDLEQQLAQVYWETGEPRTHKWDELTLIG